MAASGRKRPRFKCAWVNLIPQVISQIRRIFALGSAYGGLPPKTSIQEPPAVSYRILTVEYDSSLITYVHYATCFLRYGHF